eukprot:6239761-Amphidinium_carterae.3
MAVLVWGWSRCCGNSFSFVFSFESNKSEHLEGKSVIANLLSPQSRLAAHSDAKSIAGPMSLPDPVTNVHCGDLRLSVQHLRSLSALNFLHFPPPWLSTAELPTGCISLFSSAGRGSEGSE